MYATHAHAKTGSWFYALINVVASNEIGRNIKVGNVYLLAFYTIQINLIILGYYYYAIS